MGDRVKGKIAFIAGASAGIGRATAKLMAAEGATVIACARRAEPLNALVAEIEAAKGKAVAQVLDVSDLDAYAKALHAAAAKFGRLDILVHNAMAGRFKPISDTTLEEWRSDFLVNADATFIATREATKIMAAKGGGSIVNVGTIAAVRSVPGLGSYGASKAALIRFSAGAAIEAAAQNVRVNVVVPGTIDTDTMRQSFGNDPVIAKASAATIPMGRFGRPEELAAAILFLASDDASFITGTCLIVDGGKDAQL